MNWEPRIAAYLPGDIRQNLFGPSLDTFEVDGRTHIAYGALAGIVLCDQQLHYIETLRIQDAFPSRDPDVRHWPIHGVRCISGKSESKILAWSGKHAVIWQSKEGKTAKDTWSIWSSLTLEQDVVSMDHREDSLMISSAHDIRLLKSAKDLEVPVWKSLVTFPAREGTKCCLSPSANFMAWAAVNGNEVHVAAIPRDVTRAKATLPQSLRHRRALTNVFWRDTPGQDDFYLYTTTVDGAFRLFTVMEDDPSWFQLTASGSTTDTGLVQASLRGSTSTGQKINFAQPFVAFGVDESLAQGLGNTRQTKRIDEEAAGHDHIMWLDRQGKLSRTVLKGLSRRPPRAISVTKVTGPGKVPVLPDVDPECMPFCYSSLPHGDNVDIAVAITRKKTTSDLVSRRVNLRTGVINTAVGPTGANAPKEPQACSLFAHLPLEGMYLDQNNVVFEDEAHYHTLVGKSGQPTLGITSTRKASRKGAQSIFLRLGQRPGLLTMSTDELKFESDMAPLTTLSTRCPSALSKLLQSDTHLEHAVATVTPRLAVLYIFQLSAAVEPQVWRVEIAFNQNILQIQQLLQVKKEGDPILQHFQHDTGQLVDKRVSQVGSLDELRLSYIDSKEIRRLRSSLEDERFTIQDITSIPIVSVDLTQVVSNGDTKIATLNGGRLRIWDTISAGFGTGLDYISHENDPIAACAFSEDQPNTLAFATGDRVVVLSLISQGRNTRWTPLISTKFPLFSITPITTLAWLPGSLLFASNSVQALVVSPNLKWQNYSSNLTDLVSSSQAPLPDAHPENLVQCVLWDNFPLVKAELRNISMALETDASNQDVDLSKIHVSGYLNQSPLLTTNTDNGSKSDRYRNRMDDKNNEWQTLLSSVASPSEALKLLSQSGIYKLTAEDLQTLGTLAKSMGYADEQAQALDRNGRRYLMLFSTHADRGGALTHEDATWALHSQSKEVCLRTVISQCPKELILWSDVRRYKVSYWIDDTQLAELAETLARNHFVTEDRNPISTSIFYFALRKPKTVWGLWRQVAGHPERAAMVKFLQNNFEDPRWQTAAVKNAYALLGKQRFQYAAAFFLLGNCPKDAINICIKHLQDFDLAIFIARIRHDRAVLLPWLIETHMLPRAQELQDKWLMHWCWWVQGEEEQAIKEIYDPKLKIQQHSQIANEDDEHHDDAITMAVLLSDLKSRPETRSICANMVSIEREMQIVRYSAHRLRTIGCEALALSVIANWHFDSLARWRLQRKGDGEVQSTAETHETRAIPKERSEKASVMAQGPAQDSAQTQGAMDFDMGAFF